jgi:hypothetical protein
MNRSSLHSGLAPKILLSTIALVVPATAHALQWLEVGTATEGCATSISVGPNNIPFITQCWPGVGPLDSPVAYLTTESSCPGCFPSLVWHTLPGASGTSVSININGYPYLLNSMGAVFVATTSQSPNDQVSELDGWLQLNAANGGCISSLAPGSFSGNTEENYTAPASSQTEDFLYGIGCGGGDRNTYAWNLNATNFNGVHYDASPGWFQLDPQQNAAGTKMVLFTEPGPNNPQIIWVLNSAGQLYSYDGYQFNQEPLPSVRIRRGWPRPTVTAITDHYIVFGGDIYQWNDSSRSWSYYVSGITAAGTQIVQLASAQAMNAAGYGVVGPSQLWGLDTHGHIFNVVASPVNN